jgi:hypothetical protein
MAIDDAKKPICFLRSVRDIGVTMKNGVKATLEEIDCEIVSNPDCLKPLTIGLMERLRALVGDVEVDIEAPIENASIDRFIE